MKIKMLKTKSGTDGNVYERGEEYEVPDPLAHELMADCGGFNSEDWEDEVDETAPASPSIIEEMFSWMSKPLPDFLFRDPFPTKENPRD